MHLLVTNIPVKFHTPDLRNFFSEMIEQGAFNCFHFRHRPHRNLITHLLENQRSSNMMENMTSRPVHISETNTVTPTAEYLDISEKIATDSDRHSRPGNVNNHARLPEIPATGIGLDRNDGEKTSKQNISNHWLSSGISGLTSLIAEKKQKAMEVINKTSTLSNTRPRIGSCDEKFIEYCTPKNQENPKNAKANLFEIDKSTNVPPSNEIEEVEIGFDFNGEAVDGNCCVCDIKEEFSRNFKELYDKKYWVNREGIVSSQQCFITDISLDITNQKDITDTEYLTRSESVVQPSRIQDFKNMIEFQPPPVMPHGNVGTPTLYFQDLIRSCQLPGTVIGKLGLKFPRKRSKKKFGQVPFDYGTEICGENVDNQKKSVVFTAAGHHIPSSVDFSQQTARSAKKIKLSGPILELEKESEEGAEVEEWERFQTYHEDVTSQDRIKERLYEKEIELVWEKGGPGLVFYTDAQYWREQEGDFDEQTADEWDVDMSIYYNKGAGDFDAQSSVAMLESNKLRSGALMQSAFRKPKKHHKCLQNVGKEGKMKIKGPTAPEIGKFEAHTRGFGRRLLESQGWTDGLGLGRKEDGLPYALSNDGQRPYDKKGFGYHGEKLEGWGMPSTSSQRKQKGISPKVDGEPVIRISTVFDTPDTVDPPITHLRTHEPTRLTHRHQNIKFSKASDSSYL